MHASYGHLGRLSLPAPGPPAIPARVGHDRSPDEAATVVGHPAPRLQLGPTRGGHLGWFDEHSATSEEGAAWVSLNPMPRR